MRSLTRSERCLAVEQRHLEYLAQVPELVATHPMAGIRLVSLAEQVDLLEPPCKNPEPQPSEEDRAVLQLPPRAPLNPVPGLMVWFVSKGSDKSWDC
jgi:hypothetical protein